MVDKYKFDAIVDRHCDEVVGYDNTYVDFWRSMRWVIMTWGFVIETTHEDRDRTTTYETLVSFDGVKAVLMHRCREGPNYNEMNRYLRDEQYPVPCRVRLLPCTLKS